MPLPLPLKNLTGVVVAIDVRKRAENQIGDPVPVQIDGRARLREIEPEGWPSSVAWVRQVVTLPIVSVLSHVTPLTTSADASGLNATSNASSSHGRCLPWRGNGFMARSLQE